MDKGGEPTPAGGIDLGGRPTVSEEKLPFVQSEQRVALEGAIQPSHSPHYKTILGPLLHNSFKKNAGGHLFFFAWEVAMM